MQLSALRGWRRAPETEARAVIGRPWPPTQAGRQLQGGGQRRHLGRGRARPGLRWAGVRRERGCRASPVPPTPPAAREPPAWPGRPPPPSPGTARPAPSSSARGLPGTPVPEAPTGPPREARPALRPSAPQSSLAPAWRGRGARQERGVQRAQDGWAALCRRRRLKKGLREGRESAGGLREESQVSPCLICPSETRLATCSTRGGNWFRLCPGSHLSQPM